MTHQPRLLVAGTALVAGLWFLSGAAAAPVLPAGTYKKAAEADIAQIQKHLEVCAKEPGEAKRFAPTAKSMAMILAAYGEGIGDADLKNQSLKVAAAAGELLSAVKTKNDAKITAAAQAAGAEAQKLAVKPGKAPLKAAGLEKMAKYNLEEVMSPFRGGKFGGLNIEKDIKDMIKPKDKDPLPVDPAAVEILAARVAVIGDFTLHFPNEKAAAGANKTAWEKLSKDMTELSKTLAAESGKGKAANAADIIKTLKLIDAKCSDCHTKFRDD